MQIALWIVSAFVALAFLASGLTKIFASQEALAKRMPFSRDYTRRQVRAIGIVEVLGAIGVILPVATGILPWLTVVAAFGLVLTMIGAIVVHLRRNEASAVPVNIVLLVLALFVAVGRLFYS